MWRKNLQEESEMFIGSTDTKERKNDCTFDEVKLQVSGLFPSPDGAIGCEKLKCEYKTGVHEFELQDNSAAILGQIPA